MMPSIAEKLTTAIQYLAMHIAEASSGMINKIGIVSVGSGLTILSIVGSTMFIIKIVVDIYYARKKDKREQDLHDRNRVTK